MAKVFLDVGAQRGETAKSAAKYDFDVIHCFEPSSRTRSLLGEIDPRVQVHPFGLFSETLNMNLLDGRHAYGSTGEPVAPETCSFVRASDWVRENITPGDFVIMKINVEGAEVEILKDLDAADMIPLFTQIVVTDPHGRLGRTPAAGSA